MNIIESKQEWPVIKEKCSKCILEVKENEELEALKKENLELKSQLEKPKCEKCGKLKP